MKFYFEMVSFKRIILCVTVLCVTGIMSAYIFFVSADMVYSRCVTEAGTPIEAADFAIDSNVGIAFAEDDPGFDIFVPGEYPVKLRVGIMSFVSILTVQDTISPVAKVREIISEPGKALSAIDFLYDIEDMTDTTASFINTPDINHYGTQDVSISLTDLGGNSTVFESTVTISPLVESVTIEAGDKQPDSTAFLASKDANNMELVTLLSNIDTSKVGRHPIAFKDGDRVFRSELIIEDTTPPSMTVRNVNAYLTSILSPESFIVSASDISEYTISFENNPDMSKEGSQEVVIIANDIAGNQTTKTATLTLQPDTDPPVITGVKDISVYVGEGISYRNGVNVSDNCDSSVSLDINTSGANAQNPGIYSITYTATDRAGNSSVQTATLTVKAIVYDQATIDALADAVLSRIINPGMGNREKMNAIYNWVRGHISYANHSDKGNWLRGAFEGLYFHKGDCYVYYATAKALLNRAGIPNLDIQKLPGYRSMHYWNLVNIGEGWYHFDTCPRVGGGVFNYITDAELMSYSASHNNSHIYDKSLYPEIQ